ncbi:MAG: electron transport complex subunit RsxA [Candidatus Brocadiaceae bacterium]|nr:electron transport complex subunit RsxA [Candidatus Brocadiaceae bacterium]
MDIGQFFSIAFSAIFVSNFLLARFLGLCPFIGVTQKTESAVGMGAAVTFVMFLASFVTFLLYRLLLLPSGLALALKTPMFILVIAALVQLLELFMRARLPSLYQALGIYLPLITTNCAVMGVALLNTSDAPEEFAAMTVGAGLLAASWRGICAGLGFTLAMLLMSGVRERLARVDVPAPLRGMPIAFICTGMMAMAFLGFAGMV